MTGHIPKTGICSAAVQKDDRKDNKTYGKEVDTISMTEISYPQYKNYREFIDENGNKIYKNKKTGKEHKAIKKEIEYMEGGKVNTYTAEQATAMEKFQDVQDKKEQAKLERRRNREIHFYFVLSKDRRGILKPHTIARLFYLATFLHYGRGNILRHSNCTPIKRSELPRLMRLSNRTFLDFWTEIEGKYIFEQKDGSLSISAEFFRGRVNGYNMEHSGENGCQQIYIKSLQELYRQTPVKRHRYLGYLFLILPFINWEYNILCRNPWESNPDKIDIITLEEFCDMIGYDGNRSRNSSKILDAYKHITFTWRGKQQEVCAYLVDKVAGKNYFVVNPFVVYRGSDRRKVEALGMFFPMREIFSTPLEISGTHTCEPSPSKSESEILTESLQNTT